MTHDPFVPNAPGSGEDLWFDVVLHEPEIPNNTGSVGRSCIALGAALHLVHPLGFDIDEKAVRRAGMDYWHRLALHEHPDWSACAARLSERQGRTVWAFSSHATRSVFDAPVAVGDAFVFGSESRGLPETVTNQFSIDDRLLALPMRPGFRSLNLANAVTAVLFEGVRRGLVSGSLRADAGARLFGPAAIPRVVGGSHAVRKEG